jgi:hypothetical protein
MRFPLQLPAYLCSALCSFLGLGSEFIDTTNPWRTYKLLYIHFSKPVRCEAAFAVVSVVLPNLIPIDCFYVLKFEVLKAASIKMTYSFLEID